MGRFSEDNRELKLRGKEVESVWITLAPYANTAVKSPHNRYLLPLHAPTPHLRPELGILASVLDG